MNRARARKIIEKNLNLRNQLWPDLDENLLWIRTEKKGFTTIPRTMPYILQIMDELVSGKPVSKTYLTLWCRVFDESFVEVKSPSEFAFESGFTGERAISVWKTRMKQLKEIGFIDTKSGASGEYNFILLFNPYVVIKNLKEKKSISERFYNALFARSQEIGATDLLEG